MMRNIQRRPCVYKSIVMNRQPFMIFQKHTGKPSGRPIRLNRHLARSVTEPSVQKAAWHGMACYKWCLSWVNVQRKNGGDCAAFVIWKKWLPESHLKIELKSLKTVNQMPLEVCINTRFDNILKNINDVYALSAPELCVDILSISN